MLKGSEQVLFFLFLFVSTNLFKPFTSGAYVCILEFECLLVSLFRLLVGHRRRHRHVHRRRATLRRVRVTEVVTLTLTHPITNSSSSSHTIWWWTARSTSNCSSTSRVPTDVVNACPSALNRPRPAASLSPVIPMEWSPTRRYQVGNIKPTSIFPIFLIII